MTHRTQEEADRINSESDLIVPSEAIADPNAEPTEGFLEQFSTFIVGGVASGVAFFGITKLTNHFSRDPDQEEQEKDVIPPEESIIGDLFKD